MKLSREQFERETSYRLALSIAKALLGKGLLTKEEYRRADEGFVKKYRPVWGHLPDVTNVSEELVI